MTRHWHARTPAQRHASARDLRTLFKRCLAGDAHAREVIIVRFLPYAHRLARRYTGRGEPAEDLYQAASVGLIKAVDRYKPERGDSFVAFATPTILGEIRRHFRDATWRVHVPRSIQDRARQVASAHEELLALSSSEPTPHMIAEHLGLELDEVAETQGALKANWPGSLDEPNTTEDGQQLALSEIVGEADPGYEQVDTSLWWARALSSLTVRNRNVLLMRFGGELTQTEIARLIGVSQMQVSRIIRNSTATVAAALELERERDGLSSEAA
jgi:RNA polymerase sigma-B factor